MDKELKLTLADDGIIVEVEGKKLKVSYKQAELPFAKARDWCKENGGGDETVENLRLIAKYRDKINEQLTAASKVAKAIRKGNIFIEYDELIPTNKISNEVLLEELQAEAGDILWQLSGLCEIMGWKLEDVAQGNLDKLASRKERGVIDGNGDNR